MPNSLAVAHAPPIRVRLDDTHRKEQLSRPPQRAGTVPFRRVGRENRMHVGTQGVSL